MASNPIYPERRNIAVQIISGPTGCGKTSWALNTYPGAYFTHDEYRFTDYSGQEVLIIDQFNNQIRLSKMLRILDGYPLEVYTGRRTGYVDARWTRVIITTLLKPHEIYEKAKPAIRAAFFRRVPASAIVSLWDGETRDIAEVLSQQQGELRASE